MTKRVLLFLATNFLVLLTIYLMINLFGLDTYLARYGINYPLLGIICLLWGTAGAFVSLFFSKFLTIMVLKLKIIHPQHATLNEKMLLEIVYQNAQKAGLTRMPEVGIYRSPELNAFSTGPSREKALIAVSSGLLINMQQKEIEG